MVPRYATHPHKAKNAPRAKKPTKFILGAPGVAPPGGRYGTIDPAAEARMTKLKIGHLREDTSLRKRIAALEGTFQEERVGLTSTVESAGAARGRGMYVAIPTTGNCLSAR